MDFTPGGFRHATKEQFEPIDIDAPAPMVRGTRCHQLAMSVIYESALTVYCDSPYEYRKSPAGLEFYKKVPTTWEATKVINAKVGVYVTIARRSGDTWFVGSMNDWTSRTLQIPLDFLGKGKYTAHIWSDSPNADKEPAQVTEMRKTVTADDIIKAQMAPAGGQVIILKPK